MKGALVIYLEAKGAPGRKSLGNTGLDDYAELNTEEDGKKSGETKIPMVGLQDKSDSERSYQESESSEPTKAW